jgi:hypothetical protein
MGIYFACRVPVIPIPRRCVCFTRNNVYFQALKITDQNISTNHCVRFNFLNHGCTDFSCFATVHVPTACSKARRIPPAAQRAVAEMVGWEGHYILLILG